MVNMHVTPKIKTPAPCRKMVDYKAIQEFLNYGSYPVGYSKDQKRSLRRKAKLNFQVKSGDFEQSNSL